MVQFSCKPFSEFSLEELYEVMALRQEVFVVEQDCPYLDADGKDQVCWHLMGYENEKLVAYTRLVPVGVSYEKYPSIGRVITVGSVRGRGVGVQLMEASIQQCETLFGKMAIKIGAQCYLLKFYNSLGFESVGEEYLEDGIPHISMVRKA
ncbi:MAG: ElaA protein [Paraglaciecola sp.]|jgi:ElaA protein